MADFIISYDLHNQRNYEPVWALLESWGATRLLESLWVVSIDSTPRDLRDALNGVIDHDDSTVVIALKPGLGWGTMRARKPGVQWLRSHLSS